MTQCNGMNCGTTTGDHSPECRAEHAAAVAGGTFVKSGFGLEVDSLVKRLNEVAAYRIPIPAQDVLKDAANLLRHQAYVIEYAQKDMRSMIARIMEKERRIEELETMLSRKSK